MVVVMAGCKRKRGLAAVAAAAAGCFIRPRRIPLLLSTPPGAPHRTHWVKLFNLTFHLEYPEKVQQVILSSWDFTSLI